jgi:hypothetical protein
MPARRPCRNTHHARQTVCEQAEYRERANRSAPMIRICVRHGFCRQVPLGMQIGGIVRGPGSPVGNGRQ